MSEYHSDVKRSFVDLDPEFEQGHSNPAGKLSVGGKILRVVCAVIVMAVSDFFVILVSYILMTLIPGLRGMGNSADLGWEIKVLALLVNGVAVLAALLMCYVLMRTLDRGRGVSLHLRPSVSGGVWMVAMIVVAAVVLWATVGITHALGGQGQVMGSSGSTLSNQLIFGGIATGFLLQGIPEELVWRGWFFSSMGSTRAAAVTSVLVFTVLHLISQGGQQNVLEHVIYLANPLGFAIAAMAVRIVSGSTWAAIGVHGGFHLANALLGERLGALEGPTTWVVAGLLWAAVGAVIIGIGARTGRLRLARQ